MTDSRVAAYDSLGSEYDRAFAVFLAHTDQKDKAHAWLARAVGELPSRRLFIDAGAGTGKVTAWLAGRFDRTIAIEPNPHLRVHLARNCPNAEIVPAPVLDYVLPGQADFVLVSHVFYYIPAADWHDTLDRLASFLAPAGALVVVLQNPGTDCMRLVEHFHGRRFDLPAHGRAFEARHNGAFHSRIETVACQIETADFESACTISEFMLNLLPLPEPPPRADLETYVRKNFAGPGGGFRFSCSQDFLVIERQRRDR